MAAVAPLPRPSSSAGAVTRRNLPVIQHPSSKLGNKNDLSIRGQSGMGSRCGIGSREKTFVAIDSGKVTLGLDRSNLPPLDARPVSPWPGPVDSNPKQGKGKYSKPIGSTPRYNQNELECLLADKISTGFHGLKHLFRSNDPTGQGVVSREAFQRILYSLVGYISSDQFQRLLQHLGLENKTYITFDNFVGCFRENDSIKREWVSPVQKLSLGHTTPSTSSTVEEHLRTARVSYRDGYISGAFALSLLKEHFKHRQNDIHNYLPATCFEDGAMVVQPHVTDIVASLAIKLTEEEAFRLWQRIDYENTGAVHTSKFFKILNLDESGHPRPMTTPRTYSRKSNKVPKSATKGAVPTAQKENNQQEKKEDAKNEVKEKVKDEIPQSGRKVIKVNRKVTPRLDRAIDCLFWKFEEPYNSLEMGLQCFDFLGDGYVSRVDLKKVFEEFGFTVGVIELEHFLSKSGIRTSHGQILYKELLMRFWNKGESSLVHRIVTNPYHTYSKTGVNFEAETLDVEQLEAKLIDFLHGDYLRLITTLKKCDKYNIGVVTQHEFRECVDRALGYSMSNAQWEDLLNVAGTDDDGLVPYVKFISKFNISPGSWNHKDRGMFKVQQVSKLIETPAALENCKNNAKTQKEAREQKSKTKDDVPKSKSNKDTKKDTQKEEKAAHGKSLEEMNKLVGELLQNKFYTVDTVFKSIDRRMTGRFNRWQFAEILRQCGIILNVSELDRLWTSFPLGTDGMFNFTTMVRHFMDEAELKQQQQQPEPTVMSFQRSPVVVPTCDVDESTNLDIQDLLFDLEKAQETSRVQFTSANKERENVKVEDKEKTVQSGANTSTSLSAEEVLQKIKPQVVTHWEKLKALFRHLDRMGSCYVKTSDIKDVLNTMKIASSNEEIDIIVSKFEQKKDGKFNYIDFLKCYTNTKSHENHTYNKMTHRLETRQSTTESWPEPYPSIADVQERVRVKLLKDWTNIKRAFKKFDSSGKGYLTIGDFKKVLDSCSVKVGDEDLYHILSEFDTNMNGKIAYEQFMAELMAAC